jgi:hypothetical protein
MEPFLYLPLEEWTRGGIEVCCVISTSMAAEELKTVGSETLIRESITTIRE